MKIPLLPENVGKRSLNYLGTLGNPWEGNDKVSTFKDMLWLGRSIWYLSLFDESNLTKKCNFICHRYSFFLLFILQADVIGRFWERERSKKLRSFHLFLLEEKENKQTNKQTDKERDWRTEWITTRWQNNENVKKHFGPQSCWF